MSARCFFDKKSRRKRYKTCDDVVRVLRFELKGTGASALVPKAGLKKEALSSRFFGQMKKPVPLSRYRFLVRVLRFELKAS